MKRLLFGLLALLALLVAAVLIVPSFVNWNTFKPELVAQVRKATGRDLAIDGDVRLKVLPSPALAVSGARFANIEGAPTPDMATLKSLDVRVRLVPLLTGEIQVESVRLVEPTVVLERLADGRAGWQLAALAGDDTGGGPPLRLDLLEVDNATVIYRDLASGQEIRITALSFTGSAVSATGPFEAKGDGRLGDLPVRFEVRSGDFATGRPVPLLAIFGLQGQSGKLAVAGTVSRGKDGAAFAGTIDAEAADPAALLARAGLVLDLPAPLQGKLDLDGKLEATATQLAANDLTLRLGETQATGAVSVALAGTPSIDATVALNRVDLDALLAANTGAASEVPALPLPPAGIQASLNLSVDGVAWRQGVLRQVRLQASLHEGTLTIGQFGALLPGGSDLQLLGTVDAVDGAPRFEGQVEMSADNLRGLLTWLQVDAGQVPAGRLANMALTTRLRATPTLVEVYGLNLRLDASTITGGMAFLIQQRPSFGIDLAVDRLNLDGYLPRTADEAGAPTVPPLAALDRFDTNFKLKVGKLTYNRMPIDDVAVDLSLVGGALDLRQATVANLAGASASLAASGTGLGQANAAIDAKLRLLANDITGLARLAKVELPVPPASLGKADLSLALAGTAARLDVDLTALLGEARLTAKGAVAEALRQPRADLVVEFGHPSLAGLSRLLDLPVAPLQGSDSAVAITAAVKGNGNEVAVDGTVRAVGATLTTGGRFSELQAEPKLDIAVNLQHADLRGFLRGLGVAYDPALRQLGGLGMSARLTGGAAALDIADLKAVLGPVQLEGTGALQLDGPRPHVRADLKTNQVIADFFLAPMVPGGGGPGGGAAAAMPAAGRWSREPIDLTGLGAVDADIELAASQISFDRYDFIEPRLSLGLREGVLSVAPLTGTLFGGQVKLTGELASRPRPALKLDVDLQGADLRQALVTAVGQDQLSGRLNLTGSFATSGASEWALVSGLNGDATVSGGDGAVQGIDMALLSERLGRLNKLPDFLDLVARATGGGQTRLHTLAGTWQVRDGVARTADTVATLDASRAETAGVVHLPAWEVDLDTRLTLTEHPDAPPVGIDITGSLDNPRRQVQTAALEKFVAARVSETVLRKTLGDDQDKRLDKILDQTLGGSQAGSDESDPKAQQRDQIRGLLKDVLKGR